MLKSVLICGLYVLVATSLIWLFADHDDRSTRHGRRQQGRPEANDPHSRLPRSVGSAAHAARPIRLPGRRFWKR